MRKDTVRERIPLCRFFEFYTEENWREKPGVRVRNKKPFPNKTDFLRNIYPVNSPSKSVFDNPYKDAEAWMVENKRWKGKEAYAKSPSVIYQNATDEESRDYIVEFIRSAYVNEVVSWLAASGVKNNECYRIILLVIRDSLDDDLAAKSIFFRAGLNCITEDSVALIIFEFLRYVLAKKLPDDIDKEMCDKFQEDIKVVEKEALIGESEKTGFLKTRTRTLKDKRNCVAQYQMAVDYFEKYKTSQNGFHLKRALDTLTEMCEPYSSEKEKKKEVKYDYPMAHFLEGKILLQLAQKEKLDVFETQIIDSHNYKEEKKKYYEEIKDHLREACKYGIGGAYELLGDLLAENDCPSKVKEDICKGIPADSEEEDSIVRVRRHMYRFGMYCGSASSALKLADMLQSTNEIDWYEVQKALEFAMNAGSPEAYLEMVDIKAKGFIQAEVSIKELLERGLELSVLTGDSETYIHKVEQIIRERGEVRKKVLSAISGMKEADRRRIAEQIIKVIPSYGFQKIEDPDGERLAILQYCGGK